MAIATYDYIIVGAGSAGCVLANRLTQDPRTSVLLVEAGGSGRHPYISAPAGFLKTFADPRFNWCFATEPGAGVNNRAIHFPRRRPVIRNHVRERLIRARLGPERNHHRLGRILGCCRDDRGRRETKDQDAPCECDSVSSHLRYLHWQLATVTIPRTP